MIKKSYTDLSVASERNIQLLERLVSLRQAVPKVLTWFIVACIAMVPSSVRGQTRTWDITSGDGTTITGGAGTWDTSNSNWNNAGTNAAWVNGSTTAVFGVSGATTSGTVTLGTNITAGGLTFNNNGYTIGATGGTNTLTLGTGSIIQKNANATINANLVSSGAISIAGNGNLTLNGNNSGLAGGVTVGGLNTVFLGNANALGTGTFTVASGNAPAIGFNSTFTLANAMNLQGNLWSSSGNNSYSGALTVGSSGRFTLWLSDINHSGTVDLGANSLNIDQSGTGRTMTMSGAVSGTGGRIVKNGTGTTLVLTGNNNFTGGVTFNGGSIRVGTNNSALGTGTLTVNSETLNTSQTNLLATASGGGARTLSNNIVINNNGTGTTTLNLDGGFANLTLSGVISGNGGIQTASSGNVFLVGNNTYTGSTVLTGSNRLVLTGATNTSGIVVGTGTTLALRTITVNAPITGSGTVTKDISTFGSSTLNGNNTYTGATIVNIDRFSVGATGVINGTSGITVQSQWGANFNNLGSVTTPGNITVAGTATATAGGTSGGVTTDSSFFRNAGTVNANNLVLNSSPGTATGVTANRGGTYSQTAGATTLTGALTLAANGGTGAAGTLGNDAAFNLSGGTFDTSSMVVNAGTANVSGGTLRIGSGGITGTNTNTAFNLGNATLASSAAFGSNINVNLNGTTGSTIDTTSGNIQLNGTLSGTGSLAKAGVGTLILTGTNSYSGTTSVNSGTLIVNGDQTAATGAISIAAAGSLGGTGTIGGATTISGTHSAGNSAGIQTFLSSLTYNDGAVFNWELDGNSVSNSLLVFDQVNVGGVLDFSGNTTFNINLLSGTDLSDSFWATNKLGTDGWLVFNGGSLTNFSNLSLGTGFSNAAGEFSLFENSASGDVYLNFTAVPEPSSAIIVALGIGFVAIRRRWRK